MIPMPQICRVSNLKTFTVIFFLTFALHFASQQVFAQFADDFADGNFSVAPVWSGSSSQFAVRAETLWLQAEPTYGFAYLSLPCRVTHEASWEFVIGLEFNPSGANYARVYLVSDHADLGSPLNGYYVQVGSTADDVRLVRQTGNEHHVLVDSPDGLLNTSSSALHIRVVRTTDGNWELWFDPGLTGTLLLVGVAPDTGQTTSRYFGIACTFTATRADKFFFDDFIVNGSTPPLLLDTVIALSDSTLSLTFSQPVQSSTADVVSHYIISDGIGSPVSATVSEDALSVVIGFAIKLIPRIVYTLSISGITDEVGIPLAHTSTSFVFAPESVAGRDVIFSEIMADPVPSAGLPEDEYIELFNRSDAAVNLKGWEIRDGVTVAQLPEFILLPDEYVSVSFTDFTAYGNSLAGVRLPSLNNDGDVLLLVNENGVVIDSVSYAQAWYRDRARGEGGWSLELIDAERPCSDGRNWIISDSPMGGTPGQPNSVMASNPDLTGPVLLSVFPVADTVLLITFDEPMHQEVPLPSSFVFDPPLVAGTVFFADATRRSFLVTVLKIQPDDVYSLRVSTLSDCSGNTVDALSVEVSFALPQPARAGDLFLNEVLFNPRPGGADFVEIFNASPHYVNLTSVTVSTPTSRSSVVPDHLLLAPGGYAAFTADIPAVAGEYPNAPITALHTINLPPMNDDAGTLYLHVDNDLVDQFTYSAAFHSPFLKDDEGVSLERISTDDPSDDPQNWKSASGSAGYATPGYRNSNSSTSSSAMHDAITVSPRVFDPLGGTPSFTVIHYTFDRPGNVGNIRIFDDRGRIVKTLANNLLLGTDGTFRWDGDTDDGSKARIGYYVVIVEIYDATGAVGRYRETVAIAAPF
jgi:hypothetical protein